MKLIRRMIYRAKNRLAEKYERKILSLEIRLKDVPEWLRFDYRFTHPLHIAAFRVDRSTTRANYEEDLEFVGLEIALAEAYGHNHAARILKWVEEHAESDLEYHPGIMHWKEN